MLLNTMIIFALFSLTPLPQEAGPAPETRDPKTIAIEECLICHGKKALTTFSSAARRSLLRKDPADLDQALKSDDPLFRAKLFVDPALHLGSAHKDLTCAECHPDVTVPSHRLAREPATCVACHEAQVKSYERSFHGIFRILGRDDTANCVSCHTAHATLPKTDPASTVHASNIADTCSQCHGGAGPGVAGYRAHINARTDDSVPVLSGVAAFMRWLLVGVLAFFGLQSALWFIRSLPDLSWRRARKKEKPAGLRIRYGCVHRMVHLLIIISFFGLVLTGTPLAFPTQPLAQAWIRFLGGPENAGLIHRFCALLTLAYVVIHLVYLVRLGLREGKAALVGPDSLLPRWSDFRDLKNQWLWFLGLGERPRFGRWTYMEKFDYWAVVWGVAVIGISGLILWFPMFFTKFLPGWSLNAAQIVHSEEALLAVGYVFAIHFFHVHLRPLKAPMDPVIFTGRERMDHLALERPGVAELLEKSGEPAKEAPRGITLAFYLLGAALLLLGVALLIFTASSLLSDPDAYLP